MIIAFISLASLLARSHVPAKDILAICTRQLYGQASPLSVVQASKEFEAGIRNSDHLEVIGMPEMSVVGFRAKNPKQVDIFKVNDLMTKKGWHLSALQLPSALHMCFTAQHIDVISHLLKVSQSYELGI